MVDLLIYKVDHAHLTSKFADVFVFIAAASTIFTLANWEQGIIFILTAIYLLYRIANERKKYTEGRPVKKWWQIFKKSIKDEL